MLIEFSVANYLSFKERQTFSMVASKGDELQDTHTFLAPISGGKSSIRLLRSAAVYGANAAGKTNLLAAFRVMSKVVVKSASEKMRGESLPATPFMLDAKMQKMPSAFEIHFIVDKVRYEYGFSATSVRVTEEWLIAHPHGRAQNWFSREWSPKKKAYAWEFGASFAGEKNLWKKSTRDNALFFSTAVQLNSAQLQPLHDWFASHTHRPSFDVSLPDDPSHSIAFLQKNGKEKLLGFLKDADMDIDDLHVEEMDLDQLEAFRSLPETMQKAMRKSKAFSHDVHFVHLDTAGKPIRFDMGLESSGTKKTFSLAGLWLELLVRSRIFFIDEFNHHLHLALAKFLIGHFHSDKSNPHNSQLIFTTHQVSLLNQDFFRRDQIWFCEKAKDGSTTLYPLTDFHPRKGRENLEAGYISGVYGAVPFIRED